MVWKRQDERRGKGTASACLDSRQDRPCPELLDQLRVELIRVICNYLEVDDEHIELGLEREDRTVALVANIPVKNVKETISDEKVKCHDDKA